MKMTMYRLLLPLLCFLFSHTVSAISLTASVDRTTINLNESVRLAVTLDKQGANALDVSALELEFDIITQQQSSQTSIINGRISAQTQWIFILSPKESGNLLIPSLSSLGAFSDPIKIRVNDTASSSSNTTTHTNKNEDVFLESSISENKIYVQEQVLLTLRLYYRVSLSGYTPEDLTIDDSTLALTAENNFQKTVNGVPYNVLERSYAIHPQASGKISIPAQTWQVEKAANRFGFGGSSSPYLRVRSQPHSIDVMPIPDTTTAVHWLPAKSLQLEQKWQQSTITAKVGEPLSYSLILTADGLSHSQLPAISLNSNNDFTVYSDQAETDNQISANGIIGSRTTNYAVIPKATGTFTLPPVSITWWNTRTSKEETITLDAQRIIVAKSEIKQESPLSVIGTSPTENTTTPTLITVTKTHWAWKLSTLAFALLGLLFVTLWRISLKSQKIASSTTTVPHKRTQSLKPIYQKIEQAVEQQKWNQLKPLLHQWASIKTHANIQNNDDITHYFPELQQVLISLDKQLYSENGNIVWDFKQLIAILKQQKVATGHTSEEQHLSALYPA
jgi:hypothetical protein